MKAIEKRLAHLIEEDAARHLVEMGLIDAGGVVAVNAHRPRRDVRVLVNSGRCMPDNTPAEALYTVHTEPRSCAVKARFGSYDHRVMGSAFMNDQAVVVPAAGDCLWFVEHAEIQNDAYDRPYSVFKLVEVEK